MRVRTGVRATALDGHIQLSFLVSVFRFERAACSLRHAEGRFGLSVRQPDFAVVPRAPPVHEDRIHAIEHERSGRLQDIRHCRRPRVRVPVVVDGVREQAAQAWSGGVLHEYVAVVSVRGHRAENDQNLQFAVVTGNLEASGVVVQRQRQSRRRSSPPRSQRLQGSTWECP